MDRFNKVLSGELSLIQVFSKEFPTPNDWLLLISMVQRLINERNDARALLAAAS